ncbi:MAG: hypothetical protein JWO76_224 [Nocardioides sp.]|nr:hypothetical protein [Nocardioides sp.]
MVSVGAAVAAVALAAGPALAVSGHPITGTCYENGSWFTSSNVRTMSGTTIKASFSTLPSKGLVFRTLNYNTGARLGNAIEAPPDTTQTIVSGGHSGTEFVNSFRLEVSGHQDNYSFDGSESY